MLDRDLIIINSVVDFEKREAVFVTVLFSYILKEYSLEKKNENYKDYKSEISLNSQVLMAAKRCLNKDDSLDNGISGGSCILELLNMLHKESNGNIWAYDAIKENFNLGLFAKKLQDHPLVIKSKVPYVNDIISIMKAYGENNFDEPLESILDNKSLHYVESTFNEFMQGVPKEDQELSEEVSLLVKKSLYEGNALIRLCSNIAMQKEDSLWKTVR